MPTEHKSETLHIISSDTPQTDAVWRAQKFDSHIQAINAANALIKHARCIEKERDEWRRKYADALVRPDELVEQCDTIKSQFLAMDTHNAELQSENKDLRECRDACMRIAKDVAEGGVYEGVTIGAIEDAVSAAKKLSREP